LRYDAGNDQLAVRLQRGDRKEVARNNPAGAKGRVEVAWRRIGGRNHEQRHNQPDEAKPIQV
jgi:hypothetical protein